MRFEYYFQQAASWIAIVALAVGAILAMHRRRSAVGILQLIGASVLFVTQCIPVLVAFPVQKNGTLGNIELWRALAMANGAGLLLFAAGYFWEQLRVGRRRGERSSAGLIVSDANLNLLDRLLDPVTQALSAEAARRLVELRADAAAQDRLDALADKCTEGSLTPEEQGEYELLVHAANVIAVLQMNARAMLARNPPRDG